MLRDSGSGTQIGDICGHRWRILLHIDFVAVLPVLAAGFAVPQFLPQILKLRRTHDIAGLSTPWAVLTGINNAAWFGYFAASHYWFALIPSSSAAGLGWSLGIMLVRRGRGLAATSCVPIGVWTLVLVVAGAVDRRLLGVMLTGAFLVQVVPAVTAAYRTRHPTGIARGTWRLILAEVSCWAVFGVANHDGPLIVLGATGIASALLMLHRARSRNRGELVGRMKPAAHVTQAGVDRVESLAVLLDLRARRVALRQVVGERSSESRQLRR